MSITVQPPGSATIDGRELVDRARALVPLLAEHAAQAEADRRIPDPVIAALDEAGLFKLHKPREYGGHEVLWDVNLEVSYELARGCASTSWVAAIINVADWILTRFGDEVQEEIFAGADHVRCCGTLIPRKGFARRVEGGYEVQDALWGFGSASNHSSWAVFMLPVVDDAGNLVDQILAQVPLSDITVHDDWYTSGLRATGSNSLGLVGVFIPQHRTTGMAGALAGALPSERLRGRPLYECALPPSFTLSVAGPLPGMAQAVLESVLERVESRAIAYTDCLNQAEATVTHLQVAEASMRIDGSRMHAHKAAAMVAGHALAGTTMPLPERAMAKAHCGWSNRLAAEAGEVLVNVAGGSAIADRDPMQRLMRDLRAATLHGIIAPTTCLETHGRVMCGQPPNTQLL